MSAAHAVRNPLREPRAILRRYVLITAGLLVVSAMVKDIIIDEVDWVRLGTPAEILHTMLFFVPDLAFFPEIVLPLLETLLIALWGTLLAVVMAVPVAYLAARNITPNSWITYPVGRAVIVLSRSTHEVIFALIYVAALGLGPLPGILALASRSLGFVAKTTAEAIENVNRGQIEAMEATGASRLMVFLYGVVPQVLPVFVGNVIFTLEINLRRASILGLVGAGGIGYLFATVMQNVEYDRVGTIVLGIIGLVILGEFVSNRIRNRIL